MNIQFSLPQLKDLSYISVVNRSVHLNQSVKNRSLSPSSPLEQNASDNFILQGANHEVGADSRADSSISSPQAKQLEWQANGTNSRHSSGIGSPMQNLLKQVNSPKLGESGNSRSQIMGQSGNFKSPKLGKSSNSKFPDMGNLSNSKSPDMGEISNSKFSNMGNPSNFKFPDMGNLSNFKSPDMGT